MLVVGVAAILVAITTSDFGGPPEVDGVPCTGGNSYECIGLAEESLGQGLTSSPILPPPPSP
jgi:hypothetical protein